MRDTKGYFKKVLGIEDENLLEELENDPKFAAEAVIEAIWRLSAAFAGGAAMLLRQPTPKSAGATALPSALQGFLSACGCSADAVDAASTNVKQRIVLGRSLCARLL